MKSKILNTYIDALNWDETCATISRWASLGESRYICICNVHSVITAFQNVHFSSVLNNADLATPDGAPIAWMLRRLGFLDQPRINGPDLMWRYCELAQKTGEIVFLYGGSEDTLLALRKELKTSFPKLRIGGAISPPYRTLTELEDGDNIKRINESGARIVFVSLGCPKQEVWMAEHRGQVNAVLIGVGAAFDYHAGTLKRAPIWMQKYALEWLYRLLTEPRRLWKRYFFTNTLFIFLAAKQLLTKKY